MLQQCNSQDEHLQNTLNIFRDALTSLCPYMDKVDIGWHDEDAYDEWDAVAEALYNAIVGSVSELCDLAPYDLLLPSYKDRSFFVCSLLSEKEKQYVFVGFSTKLKPFDFVKCVEVNGDFKRVGELHYFPFSDCYFYLREKLESVSN